LPAALRCAAVAVAVLLVWQPGYPPLPPDQYHCPPPHRPLPARLWPAWARLTWAAAPGGVHRAAAGRAATALRQATPGQQRLPAAAARQQRARQYHRRWAWTTAAADHAGAGHVVRVTTQV